MSNQRNRPGRVRSGVRVLEPEARIMMISTHGYVSYPMQLGRIDTGGQVSFVIELSRKMGALGYAVDIFTRQFESQPPMDMVNDNVRIVRIPYGGKEFIRKEDMRPHMSEFAKNALRYIEKHKLTYQYINSHYWDAGLGGKIIAKKLKVLHFHTPHSLGIWKRDNIGGDATLNEKRWKFSSRIDVERQIYRASEKILATTIQQEELLLTRYEVPHSSIDVIPPGFDEERFMPETSINVERLRRRLKLPEKFILSLGRLAHNKGFDLLIRAFAFLVERNIIDDSVDLVLAAGGMNMTEKDQKLLNDLKRLASKLKVSKRILWLGFVADEDMPALYDSAEVFVMPSRYEPFGMVAVEAMACGTPTVISTEGGLWNDLAYGRDVLYANPFKIEELAINMAMPLNYPKVSERLSRRGTMRAHSEYTWSRIAQKTLSVFRESAE